MSKKVTLSYEGQSHEFDVHVGSEGEIGFDTTLMRSKTGLVTLDPRLRKHRELQKRHHVHRR